MKYEAPVIRDLGSIAENTFKSDVPYVDKYCLGSHTQPPSEECTETGNFPGGGNN